MNDIKSYEPFNFIVSGEIIDENFSPVTDRKGQLIDLSGLDMKLEIYSADRTVLQTLTSQEGQISFTDNTLSWYVDTPSLLSGEYKYTFFIKNAKGDFIPRLKGILIKEYNY